MNKKQIRPFGVKDEIGYVFGDMAGSFVNLFVDAYFLIFCTNVLGISAGWMGTLFLVAIILGLAGLGVHIGGQEAAAAHAGVAVALAILVYLQLEHLLLGDIVGDHPLGGTLGSQLGQVVVGVTGVDVVLFQQDRKSVV